ncbi:hypothetical protein [Actinomyces slackii]|uniref:hypothetical protein n=1 Tax=Actinomyces slackii TaxID=52774 RepID=UPI000F84D2FB|nr:hypothetical protein [Actinomyces slackii]
MPVNADDDFLWWFEFLDDCFNAYPGRLLAVMGYGQGGDNDGQVGLNGVAGVVGVSGVFRTGEDFRLPLIR